MALTGLGPVCFSDCWAWAVFIDNHRTTYYCIFRIHWLPNGTRLNTIQLTTWLIDIGAYHRRHTNAV